MLKNANGRYCYYYTPWDQWFLSDEFKPDLAMCNSSIVAKEGPLPVGDHTWRVTVGDKWEERTLTVTLQ